MTQKKVLSEGDPMFGDFGEIGEMFDGYSHQCPYNSLNSQRDILSLTRKTWGGMVHRIIPAELLGKDETKMGDLTARVALYELQTA